MTKERGGKKRNKCESTFLARPRSPFCTRRSPSASTISGVLGDSCKAFIKMDSAASKSRASIAAEASAQNGATSASVCMGSSSMTLDSQKKRVRTPTENKGSFIRQISPRSLLPWVRKDRFIAVTAMSLISTCRDQSSFDCSGNMSFKMERGLLMTLPPKDEPVSDSESSSEDLVASRGGKPTIKKDVRLCLIVVYHFNFLICEHQLNSPSSRETLCFLKAVQHRHGILEPQRRFL